jgi:hypothetical protein
MPTKYQPVSSEDVELESHLDAPLLDLEPLEDDALNDNETFHSHTEPVPSYRFSRWGVRSPKRIVILVSFIKFAIVFSGMLLLLPTARLIEDMFCHIHYKDTSVDIIDEMKCKVDEVQSQLGYLYGWNGLVTSLIGECNSELANSQKPQYLIPSRPCRGLPLRYDVRQNWPQANSHVRLGRYSRVFPLCSFQYQSFPGRASRKAISFDYGRLLSDIWRRRSSHAFYSLFDCC